MKKQIILGLFISIIATLFSCNNDESTDVEKVNKQTILVYMPWSGDTIRTGLYNIFLQNLDSINAAIEEKKGLGNSRLVVFLSKSPTESDLYEVIYENNTIKQVPITSYSGTEYTTAAGISKIISDTKQAAKALNYAMIIGCHGTGWTYKSDWTDYPYRAKQFIASPLMQDQPYVHTRFFGSVSDIANYATDIEVLTQGILQSETKMQYILFDDCYMSNIETAYMLKDVTNFIIGSTCEIIDLGMPYAKMWKHLASATPNYAEAVRVFHQFYTAYTVPSGAISVIDCRQVTQLASIMKEINQRDTITDSLRAQLQVLDGFTTPIFYDMGDYVNKLCKNTELRNRFNEQLQRVVKNKETTATIYSYIYPYKPQYITINTFSGITISDPTQHEVPLKGLHRTAWWKDTH